MKLSQKFLLLTALIFLPIALTYAAVPKSSQTFLFGITFDGTSDTHIYQAIMGLYFALSTFWLLGASREKLILPALYCLTVFMFGLAAGRALSVVILDKHHWLLFVYLALEVLFGAVGLVMIFQERKQHSR